MDGHSTEALALGGTALAAHDKLLGRHHAWTKESARVTADALDALVRTEEAKARYGSGTVSWRPTSRSPHEIIFQARAEVSTARVRPGTSRSARVYDEDLMT